MVYNTWSTQYGHIINEVDYDHCLHAFDVYAGVKLLGSIYPSTIDDHSTDTCTKIPLSQRTKTIDGRTVQRDLYSAFLILNTDDTFTHPDRDKCTSTFDGFVRRQDRLISEMKKNNISMKQCFGF